MYKKIDKKDKERALYFISEFQKIERSDYTFVRRFFEHIIEKDIVSFSIKIHKDTVTDKDLDNLITIALWVNSTKDVFKNEGVVKNIEKLAFMIAELVSIVDINKKINLAKESVEAKQAMNKLIRSANDFNVNIDLRPNQFIYYGRWYKVTECSNIRLFLHECDEYGQVTNQEPIVVRGENNVSSIKRKLTLAIAEENKELDLAWYLSTIEGGRMTQVVTINDVRYNLLGADSDYQVIQTRELFNVSYNGADYSAIGIILYNECVYFMLRNIVALRPLLINVQSLYGNGMSYEKGKLLYDRYVG